MSVKTIFKTLIGTIVIIVLSSLIIELFNINTSGVMINQYLQLSADQACVLFTQETFRSGSAGAISESAIKASDGTEFSNCGTYKMNEFYGGSTDTTTIWKNIYANAANSDFDVELDKIVAAVATQTSVYTNGGTSSIDTMFPELDSLHLMADKDGTYYNPTMPTGVDLWSIDETNAAYVEYLNKTRADTYTKNMYTPVNLGIPYIDKKVTDKMFQWNLTQLLSNCNPEAILLEDGYTAGNTDPYGYYVNFKGFAVYTRAAHITNFTYHVCDLNTAAGRTKFNKLTGMKANYNNATGQGLVYNIIDESDIDSTTKISNNVVFVVEIDYEVPVNYIGITPIRNVYNYFFNRNTQIAAGYDGVVENQTASQYRTTPETLKSEDSLAEGWDDATGDTAMQGNGKLSVGKLYYTLVR